jgi:hypothetical protein
MWALLGSDADDTLKTAVTIPSQEAVERCATKFGVPGRRTNPPPAN